jgi:hypothetical protein
VQPANLALSLRLRSPWEATDLGLAMLQRWWRPVYLAHALVLGPIVAALILAGWWLEALWLAVVTIWWLEPVYDRAVLHVLSRAVFGAAPDALSVLRSARTWLFTGLAAALTFERIDLARSFNLPVRQLEAQRGRHARMRRSVLGRRTRGYAAWLTVVWLHFEAVLIWSSAALGDLLLPAQLERARTADEPFFGGLFQALALVSVSDTLVFAAVLFLLEPFYVAAGFALYLNRRTLLEGWDIEVALRRIAARHAAILLAFGAALCACLAPADVHAEESRPKQKVAEVLRAPEFGYQREVMRWQARSQAKPRESGDRPHWLEALGYALARTAQVLLWGLAIAALAYGLWWAAKQLPRRAAPAREAYQPPPVLFGMALAPQTLPADVPGAALSLARDGRPREALALLYRGALHELTHRRGIELLPSHTEGEAVRLAGMPYFAVLVNAWCACAYAKRPPLPAELERVAQGYAGAFA